MITYEITIDVTPRLVEAYESFMRQEHIPDVLATGCFLRASFTRSAVGRYRILYAVGAAETLESYLATHAPRLRDAFAARFPEGVMLSRDVWTTIQSWDAATPRAMDPSRA